MKKSIGSGRGSVYNILLKALQTGDKYGYEICKEIEEKTNGSYILKQASLYSGLKRLEAQGDITSYWQDSVLGGRRHYYSLTEKGKERIIRSNFSWTDARDDIVDNLFEKSQLDKEIEEMQNDLNNIKDNQVLSEDNQKNIDYILENTANLGNEQKEESAEDSNEVEEKLEEENINEESQEKPEESKEDTSAGYSFGGDDLFSMFNTAYENSEEKLEEKQEAEEVDQDEESSDDNEEDEEIQNNSFEDEENDEGKQLDLFSISNEQAPVEEKKEEPEDAEDAQNDSFADIMQNMQTLAEDKNSFKDDSNDAEESIGHQIYEEYSAPNTETPENLYDNKEQTLDDEYVDKVAETYAVEETKEENSSEENVNNEDEVDDQTEKVSVLQKSDVDVLEEYRKNHVSFNRFSESTQFEEPENTFSNYFENNNIFNDNENDNKEDINLSHEHTDNQPVKEESKEENVLYYDLTNNKEVDKEDVETQKTSTLDYKDIFGDLMSSKEESTKEEPVEESKANEFVSEEDKVTVEEKEVKPQEKQNSFDDLPRIDSSMQDINRTFMQSKETKEIKEESYTSPSNSFERYDSSPFETSDRNPFEKYDTYESMDYSDDSKNNAYDDEVHKQRTNALAFDKKYANIYNKFEVPDYEVRYFKKSTPVKNTQSKFISINRLNLAVSCFLCLLMCIATTMTLIVSSKNPVSSFQTTCYILSYILLAAIILFDFTKYMLNKNKKAHTLNKNESLINLFLAIFVAILSISINLFLGMSFANIRNYMGSFTLPLYYSLYLLVKFPLKKFLSKFANFYN